MSGGHWRGGGEHVRGRRARRRPLRNTEEVLRDVRGLADAGDPVVVGARWLGWTA